MNLFKPITHRCRAQWSAEDGSSHGWFEWDEVDVEAEMRRQELIRHIGLALSLLALISSTAALTTILCRALL